MEQARELLSARALGAAGLSIGRALLAEMKIKLDVQATDLDRIPG